MKKGINSVDSKYRIFFCENGIDGGESCVGFDDSKEAFDYWDDNLNNCEFMSLTYKDGKLCDFDITNKFNNQRKTIFEHFLLTL